MVRGSEKRAKQTDEETRFINALLESLPLLKKAWEVKNAGLKIFPHKAPISRSKAARKAAKAVESLTINPQIDVDEVAHRLDRWVDMSDDLKPYFEEALNIIRDWRSELLRIATTGLNNSKAEAKVAQLRTFNRMGRGLYFEMLRRRQLWFDAFRRTNRWPSFCDDIEGKMTSRRLIEAADARLAMFANAAKPATDTPQKSETRKIVPVRHRNTKSKTKPTPTIARSATFKKAPNGKTS